MALLASSSGETPLLGRASIHPGNHALCRSRILCVGWSERLPKDRLLNVDPIADRDEIGQNAACQGPPVRERQTDTEISEERASIRRMTKSRIEPGPYECVAFLNLDATREEDPQGVNGGPANSDAGEQQSQHPPLRGPGRNGTSPAAPDGTGRQRTRVRQPRAAAHRSRARHGAHAPRTRGIGRADVTVRAAGAGERRPRVPRPDEDR
jgi:hypothetical protein